MGTFINKKVSGAELIKMERERQKHREKFDAKHDEENNWGQLAIAASCYAAFAAYTKIYEMDDKYVGMIKFVEPWPWDTKWDKRYDYGERKKNPGNSLPNPKTLTKKERLDLLVKAGALIAAEIDRTNK